jgi:hypothetical protein
MKRALFIAVQLTIAWTSLLHIQGPTEIVKHFEILVMHFSNGVSWHIAILAKALTFSVSQHEGLGS